MSRYKEIYFDKSNINSLIIVTNSGKKTWIAVPPGKNRVDIISFEKIFGPGYHYKLDGLVIITDEYYRKVIDNKGCVIDKVVVKSKEFQFDMNDPKHPWNWKK